MSREWVPGDVAQYHGERLMKIDTEDLWADTEGDFRAGVAEHCLHPLVVIDPEDREQIERLAALLWPHYDATERFANTLREYLNPTPSKPDEPLGLGAVVEDDRGYRWVRASRTSTVNHWRSADESGVGRKPYAKVNAVRVLSAGVES